MVETPTVDNTAGGGLMTNAYGVYISAQAATGITNPWGVYQLGATTKNYLQGKTGIGAVPSGTYNLEVTGTSYFSGDAIFAGLTDALVINAVQDLLTGSGGSSKYTTTATSGSYGAFVGQTVANNGSSSSAGFPGLVGRSETLAANAQDLTNPYGLRGVQASVAHLGSGTVTGAVSVYAPSITNSGGGTITTAYGVWIGDQTAGTNNWAVYTVGAAKSFFGGGIQADAPMQLKSYTLAGLPAAATWPQGMAWCSNHTGGARMVVSDATNWIDPRTGSIAA
jgi:hypothetical protein